MAGEGPAAVARLPARLSVNISSGTEDALVELSGNEGVSMTEAQRRLVGYGAIVYRTVREGGQVLLRHPDGSTERVILTDPPRTDPSLTP